MCAYSFVNSFLKTDLVILNTTVGSWIGSVNKKFIKHLKKEQETKDSLFHNLLRQTKVSVTHFKVTVGQS